MKRSTIMAVAAATILAACTNTPQEPLQKENLKALKKMPVEALECDVRSPQRALFEDGNYAMFIHFGLYSHLEGEWEGKAYYGNAEWIMNCNQADIPVDVYMSLAKSFNPSEFSAKEIVSLAKDAGMKYIIITSKHHEGFAMFASEACDFNIKDATPFGRDLIGELADECHKNGIGIGFYYSQFQDWTAPGGGNGPTVDADGKPVSFEEYFRTKCVPQVEEITTKYGEVELIWFDTPADMDIKYSKELVDLVRKNQPGALVSSRVGNGMGDYATLDDMEVPVVNQPGPWEGIDVTQVGWGYNKFDNQWKTPEYIVKTLVSTVARGGTFMMNIGPEANGTVNPNAAAALRKGGEWVKKYPQVIYKAEASPWGHALPWGDAVVNDGKIYLVVFDWPQDGKLYVPGILNKIEKASIVGGKKVKFRYSGAWTCLNLPVAKPDGIAGVIELKIKGEPKIDPALSAAPGAPTIVPAELAKTEASRIQRTGWMESFGEWKLKNVAVGMTPEATISWDIDFAQAGSYNIDIEYKGEGRYDWLMTIDGAVPDPASHEQNSVSIQNCQGASGAYAYHPLGWIAIEKAGRHSLTLKAETGNADALSIGGIKITKVNL